MSLIAELKRRNVFRVGIAYVVGGWLLLQLTDVLSQLLDLPDVVGRVIVLLVAIGLPVALFFAWAFEMTPEGVKREKDVDRSQSISNVTGQKLNNVIIGVLVVALGYFAIDKFILGPAEMGSEPFSQQSSEQTSAAEEKGALTPVKAEATPSSIEAHKADKSIAVLPFTNRSPNADDAYFTDGVHDDLLTQLAKIDAFSVISRTSVLEYRDTAKNLKQIGEELGVGNIMEGAVQRSGNRVRINVQLIDAVSDEHLWAEVYDRELTTENLFDIQSEIAKSIASALKATLTDSEIASVSDVPTKNVAAYELYLQGKRFALGETEIGFDTAVELYREALKLDPEFKLAWVGLAYAYISNYWTYGANPADRDMARDAIDKAIAIDPDFPELYMAEGSYAYWGMLDYDTALLNLDKAIALMPSNAEAHMWKGWASRRAGLWEQAIDSMQMAVKLNPRVAFNLLELGATLSYFRRDEEAQKLIEAAYKMEPDNYWAKSYLADLALRVNGDTDRASTLMVGAQHTNDMGFLFPYWNIQMMTGHFDAALDIAQKWSVDWEIDVKSINLRENLIAISMKALGRNAEAMVSAQEALSRIAQKKLHGLDDHRVAAAELEAYAILGDQQKVSELVEIVLTTKPADAVEDFNTRYRIAQNYAYAGMPGESIAILDALHSGIGPFSVPWVELDPAFNDIRNEPDFIAMLERHR
ncbi:MAG: tetratricopeptide repeat protein [Xanthomonadales bacterium]|nr:tetratricopeptide repeat protein [Xanthomonadales bacterium]